MLSLDYVVFHGRRSEYAIEGVALVAGKLINGWRGTVYTDPVRRKAGSNEDPFVWSKKWLYSYCHTSQLRRAQSNTGFVQTGSMIFFCDFQSAKADRLKVDTVFVIGKVCPWQERAKNLPLEFASEQVSGASDAWLRHFRHGTRTPGEKGHRGLITYVADHDRKNGSFLPIGSDGQSATLELNQVFSSKTSAFVKSGLGQFRSYPRVIPKSEAVNLYDALTDLGTTRVFSILNRA